MTLGASPTPCNKTKTVFAYAVHALSPADTTALQLHMASCAACQAEFERLRRLVSQFVSWPADVLRPADSLQARLARRIAEETGQPVVVPPPSAWSEPEWDQVAD